MLNPNILVARAYLGRGASIWLGARLVGTFVAMFARRDPGEGLLNLLEPSPLFVVAPVLIAYVDIGLARERTILGNLGIPMWWMAVPIGAAAIAGEVVLGLVTAWLR